MWSRYALLHTEEPNRTGYFTFFISLICLLTKVKSDVRRLCVCTFTFGQNSQPLLYILVWTFWRCLRMEMEESHFGLVQVLIYFLAYKYLRLLIVYLGTITVVWKSSDLFSQEKNLQLFSSWFYMGKWCLLWLTLLSLVWKGIKKWVWKLLSPK